MNGFTKYVLLKSETDHHIKAIVDKRDYPEAVAVTVLPFDLQEFNNNPYVYTVENGVYKRDFEEDTYRKNLEKQNKELNDTIALLMQQVAELQGVNGGTK